MLTKMLVVLVAALAALAGAARVVHLNGTDDNSDRSVDYDPLSGMMKMCEGASCTQGRRMIQFRLSRLQEVTSSLVPVQGQYVDLEPLSFGYSPLPPVKMNDTDGNPFTPIAFQVVRNVSLHGSVANNITLNVTGLVVLRQLQMFMYGANNNLTVDLPARGLKLYFQISHWPFQSPQNLLLMVGKIKVKSRHGVDRRPPQVDGDDRPVGSPDPMHHRRGAPVKRFRLGDDGDGQFLDSPSAVVVDGSVVENVVQIRQDASDEHEMAYVWRFPYFHDTLVYDPTFGMTATTGTTTTATTAPGSGAPTSSSSSVAPGSSAPTSSSSSSGAPGSAVPMSSSSSVAALNPLVFAAIALAFLLF